MFFGEHAAKKARSTDRAEFLTTLIKVVEDNRSTRFYKRLGIVLPFCGDWCMKLGFIALFLFYCSLASGEVTLTIQESGGNVTATVSGAVNTASLSPGKGDFQNFLYPSLAYVLVGASGSSAYAASKNVFSGVGGLPTSWGVGGQSLGPISASGDEFGVYRQRIAAKSLLLLPAGYVSGAPISGSSTYPGSLSSLGLTEGAHTYALGFGPNSDKLNVNIIGIPLPAITSVDPKKGPITGDTTLTITGTDFLDASDITVAGATCTSFTVVDATTATCVTPAGNPGAASVAITTPGGTSLTNALFTYVPPPTVVSVKPIRGSTGGGTTLTITGTDFLDASDITVAGATCTSFTVVDATTATCVTPAGNPGAASVDMTTPGGTNAGNTLFAYVNPGYANGIGWKTEGNGALSKNKATFKLNYGNTPGSPRTTDFSYVSQRERIAFLATNLAPTYQIDILDQNAKIEGVGFLIGVGNVPFSLLVHDGGDQTSSGDRFQLIIQGLRKYDTGVQSLMSGGISIHQ